MQHREPSHVLQIGQIRGRLQDFARRSDFVLLDRPEERGPAVRVLLVEFSKLLRVEVTLGISTDGS